MNQSVPPTCDARRGFLTQVAGGLLGLNLSGTVQARLWADDALRVSLPEKIRSCIVIFYYGGPSHIDTLDMKPDAPANVRGEFKPISTSAPGVQVCEHLPRTAKIMHKVAVVRSMHHANRLHDSAATETLTGRPPTGGDKENFAPTPQTFPCHGASLSYVRRDRDLDVGHAALPWIFHNVIDVPCQGGGFLGSAYDPFQIEGDPDATSYQARMLARPQELTIDRIAQRRALRKMLNHGFLTAQRPPSVTQLQSYYEKAYGLLESETVRTALDIDQEDRRTRERYGWDRRKVSRGSGNGAEMAYGRNLRGQNLLLARRLVEADVPFINVYDYKQQGQNWDAHKDNFNQHKDYLLPPADQAFAALIEDLDERGLLDSTLVIATGEFGRTPNINKEAGRDHWPDCYSLMFAGGGVKGGFVYGASDKTGAYPDLDPVSPADLSATIYSRFGVDPETEIHDQATGRPYKLSEGRVIEDLFAT